jgi:hypothetical protein
VLNKSFTQALMEWRPVSERILSACFRHMHGFFSVFVCYAPTEQAEAENKDIFYQALDDLLVGIHRNDLVICLGYFNAVSGTNRLHNDIIIGPFGSGAANDNSNRMVSFCRRHRLLIGGSWFRRKDIHQCSWYSNNGNTRKEIDHILVRTRWKSIANCRVCGLC